MTPNELLSLRKDKLVISQEAMAKLLGITQAAMSYKETGSRPITKRDLIILKQLTSASGEPLEVRDE